MNNRKRFYFYSKEDIYQKFMDRYPFSSSRFIENCIVKALADKDFFDRIYFSVTSNKEVLNECEEE